MAGIEEGGALKRDVWRSWIGGREGLEKCHRRGAGKRAAREKATAVDLLKDWREASHIEKTRKRQTIRTKGCVRGMGEPQRWVFA